MYTRSSFMKNLNHGAGSDVWELGASHLSHIFLMFMHIMCSMDML